MLNIAFFYHGNLVQRELLTAFRKLPGVNVCVFEIATFTTAEQADLACRLIKEHACQMLVTVNDWGLDTEGRTSEFLRRNKIVHVNWHVDDPFYYQIRSGYRFPPMPNRFDFVSDRGYVEPFSRKGYNVFFLPLAADTGVFAPSPELTPVRDICFVGNSYREEMDELVEGHDDFIEEHLQFMKRILERYAANMLYPIEKEISGYLSTVRLPGDLSPEMAEFLMKHFVGYLYRKKTVVSLSARYPDFMVFGDVFWIQDLPKEKVSTGVGYYLNLSKTYQQTRINVDINRMVIRDGFTQRVFDCLASGAFLITSPKKVVQEFFTIHGPGQELVVFRNEEHLMELIDYYLAHEDERKAIAGRGQAKVLREHTYDHRVRQMLAAIRNNHPPYPGA